MKKQRHRRGTWALCGLGIENFDDAIKRGSTGIEGTSTAWFLLRVRADTLYELMARGRGEGVEQLPGETREEMEREIADGGRMQMWTRAYETVGPHDMLLSDLMRAVNPIHDAVYMGKGRRAFTRLETIAAEIHGRNDGTYVQQKEGFPSFTFAIEGNPFQRLLESFERGYHGLDWI